MKNKTLIRTFYSVVVIIITIIIATVSGVLSFFWDMVRKAK